MNIRIKKLINKCECDVVIPRWEHFNPNFYYFTGYDVDHCIAHINESGLTVYTTALNERLCRKLYKKRGEVVVFSSIKEVKEKIGKAESIDVGYISYALYRKIRCRGMKAIDEKMRGIREIKERWEIKEIKKAKKIIMKILREIRTGGRKESEIKREIKMHLLERDAGEAFGTIVANSTDARFPHYFGGKIIVKDYALVDAGARYGHYNSDITRCIGRLGEMQKRYERLQNAVDEISDEAYAGRDIKEFVMAVDKIIKMSRLKKFPHSIGHGVGLEVHELPFLSAGSKGVLRENSIITIEPGQYEKKGLRYEDMFLVGKKRAKLL